MPGVTVVCKVYFGIYLLLIAFTCAVLIEYRRVRMRNNGPALFQKDTSKFWIVVVVMSLQVCRTLYFSTAFLAQKFEDNVSHSVACLLDWTTKIPSLLEFMSIFIIHDFLLRLNFVISNKMAKYKTCLNVYTSAIMVLYTLLVIIDSSIYCANEKTSGSGVKYVQVVQAGMVIFLNPVIVITVLRGLRHRLGS